MAERNRLEVRIGGNEYKLVGTESEEYMQKVAMYIDKKINEIMRSNHKLSTSMAAVLTAVNVADDFFKIREQAITLNQELKHLRQESEALRSERKRLLDEQAYLNEKNAAMQIELVKREAELNEVRNTIDRVSGSKLYIAK